MNEQQEKYEGLMTWKDHLWGAVIGLILFALLIAYLLKG